MKKVLFCFILCGIIVLSGFLGACKKSSGAEGTAASAGVSGAAEEISVMLLTDATGVDDKSFNSAAWRGIIDFYGDTWEDQSKRGKSYYVVTAQTQDMYIPNIRQATDEGYDLIVTTGFTFSDSLEAVAKENPDQHYMIVDVDWVNLPNVMQATYAEHEGSYLVGVAAALKAKADGITDPSFGFIGGIASTTITKFEVGYIQGILSVFPNARIVDYYVNSWGDAGLAKTQAKNWYDNGVYAIYSAAGGSGNGTIAQAKEYRAAGKNVWAIGVDSDQFEEGLYNTTDSAVLTSMLKRVETSLIYALKAEQNNNFKGEVILFDLKADGVGYSAANPAMTGDIKNELEQIRQKIVSGQIKIAATYADAKQLPGFPQDLMAMD